MVKASSSLPTKPCVCVCVCVGGDLMSVAASRLVKDTCLHLGAIIDCSSYFKAAPTTVSMAGL